MWLGCVGSRAKVGSMLWFGSGKSQCGVVEEHGVKWYGMSMARYGIVHGIGW